MAPDPQTLRLRRASHAEAARAFAACQGLDPQGTATPESAASAGECFQLEADTGTLVYSVSAKAGRCWIHGAAGQGEGMTEAGLAVIEAQAEAAGCYCVEFQTMRRGLVKKARARGYHITRAVGRGFILGKTL